MSQAPPPYLPPPAPPQKRRPSGWWFVVGGVLVAAAVAVGIGLFVWTLSGFLDSDGVVPADGRAHQLTVGTDRDRMLWSDGDDQTCSILDVRSGTPVELRPVHGHVTRSDSQGDFEGLFRFAPGSGHLSVTCRSSDLGDPGSVLIGPTPRIGSFVVGIVAAILVPGVLGLAGLVVLVITGVLFATRPARPKGAAG